MESRPDPPTRHGVRLSGLGRGRPRHCDPGRRAAPAPPERQGPSSRPERIGAGTALRIGLVSEITTLDELWPRARELATTIAAKPPAATAGSIKAIWESLDLPRSVALQQGLKYCQIGNPVGVPQVNRAALMADKAKKFTIR